MVVHYGLGPETSPVKERVRDKIHGPALIHLGGLRPADPWSCRHAPSGPFRSKIQALLAIEPIHPLVVDLPSFALQQHVNAKIAVPDAHSGDLLDPHPKSGLLVFAAAVVPGGSPEHHHPARPFLAHLVLVQQMLDQFALTSRP